MLTTHCSQEVEAGCDEAGRGSLAGPVVAAAVILPQDFHHPLLNDSKQLTALQRQELEPIIRQQAHAFGIGEASPAEIDRINILQATFLAMHRAIDELLTRGGHPKLLLIDGPRFRHYPRIPHQCIVRGDATYASIAAASILAKTHRDRYMHGLADAHPGYSWETNVGYPTLAHRRAIQKLGITTHHRRTFINRL